MKKIFFAVVFIFSGYLAFGNSIVKYPLFESQQLCDSVKPFCGDNCTNSPFYPTLYKPAKHGSA